MHLPIRFGTRASPMAVKMAEGVRDLVRGVDASIAIQVETFLSKACMIPGDLKDAGGKGLFVKDLERRLLDGEIDCALHALKDVPGDEPMHPDLVLLAFMSREDPSDALVLRRGINEPDLARARVGTSAPRRAAILRRLFPGISIEICRGNVNTRIRQLDEGRFDALVVSTSGLKWLGLESRITRRFTPAEMLPAVGQGIVCVQVRKSDVDRCRFLREINDTWSEFAATAERQVLSGLRGDCHSAIAAHCRQVGAQVVLQALVMAPDGENSLSAVEQMHVDDVSLSAAALGRRVVSDLVAQGALDLLR
ncbi:MAG: hypothetical protein JWR80_8936 [Bradyrhizobium sp.]|nr:hypothetical protein [Bradyrhizobium sp.]